MKKFLTILCCVLSLISCENTQINEVVLQAKIDDDFYISTDARAAVNDDGTVTILGNTRNESLTLKLSRLAEGDFIINEGRTNTASYQDFERNLYTTIPFGEGIVNISRLDENNKTLTGTFKFTAYQIGIDTIFVSKGVLYNIPYTGAGIDNPNNAGSFTAKVNDVRFTPITVTSQSTGNSIITSAATSSANIVISLPSDVEVGDYTLPLGNFQAKYQGANGPETTTEGRITILEHNPTAKVLKATFSFNTSTTTITEGRFEVSY